MEEPLEGVSIERRQVVYISLGAIAALGLRWPQALAQSSVALDGDLPWNALLEHAVPMAEKLVQSLAPDEEEYLLSVGGLIQRLARVPEVEFEKYDDVDFAWTYNKFPINVAQYRLAAGAAIPYHDHRDYNGVLMIVEGGASIRSFEFAGTDERPPSGTTFLIRETKREMLVAGQVSTLSRTRENIHDIRAGTDGARFLDVFTFFTKDGKSTFLRVDERSREPSQSIYEASWQE